jgi:hypothetical protein
MPFRSFRKDVEPGGPVRLYVAEGDDQEIEIRAASLSDDNLSVGFTFRVGGPDMAKTGGLVCFDSQWKSTVEEGDEVWVEVYGAAFTTVTPITVLVRAGKRSDRMYGWDDTPGPAKNAPPKPVVRDTRKP